MRLFWDHFGFREPNGGIASYALHLEKEAFRHEVAPVRIGFPKNLSRAMSLSLSKKPTWLWWLAASWLPKNVAASETAVFHGLANFNIPLVAKNRWPNLRFFLTVHDIIPLLTRPRSALSLQMKALMPERLKRCDAIICVSDWAKQSLLEKFGAVVPAGKVFVIPHGRALAEARISSREENGARNGLLFVSRYEAYKGFDLLFDLMRLGNDTFTVVTNAEGRVKVKSFLASEPGLTAKVTVLSDLSRMELLQQYDLHEMLLQPSWFEGFGFPVQEALLRCCPVIYRKGSGMDAFGEGPGLLSMERDAGSAAWKNAIVSLRGHKNLDELYASCGKHLQSWPTWEDVYHKLFSIYSLQNRDRDVQ